MFFNKGKSYLDSELVKVQKNIKEFSNRGLNVAKNANSLLKTVIKNATNLLDNQIEKVKIENFNTANTYQMLCNQLIDIKNNLNELPKKVEQDIKKLSKDIFTITLFGRTLAGKSTLKEILTKGDGRSIGKGAQRTTRDVRKYKYKNLQVIDVPGIAAFEGEEDETIAFEAAKQSDLILFLITTDGNYAREAECMAKIVSLGKPIICIINIKICVDKEALDLFYEEIEEKMKQGKSLNESKKTFLSYAKQYGQDWSKITFVCTHLKSAFLSQQKEFFKDRFKLYKSSRFINLESIIIKEIINKGTFYKFKAFSDIVIVPMTKAFNSLFEYSIKNSSQGTILTQKKKNFNEKTKEIKELGENKINSFIEEIRNELKNEIANFVEDNYDNNKAGEEWEKIKRQKGIENRANNILEELREKCEQECDEIGREIEAELNIDNIDNTCSSLNMSTIRDTKKYVDWGTTIIGGGLIVAGILFSNPIGWASIPIALIGGLISHFFCSDKKDKLKKNRNKLEKKLNKNIENMLKNLNKDMKNCLYGKLIKNMNIMSNLLYEIIGSLYDLSNMQQKLASELNKKLKEINKMLILEALKFLDCENVIEKVKSLARTPGQALMFVLEDKEIFPENIKFKLSNLLNEKIWFIFDNNIKSILNQGLGKNRDGGKINIEEKYIDGKLRIVKIIEENLEDNIKVRIPLTQQLTELLIIKK